MSEANDVNALVSCKYLNETGVCEHPKALKYSDEHRQCLPNVNKAIRCWHKEEKR
jgi:hypothetical protein